MRHKEESLRGYLMLAGMLYTVHVKYQTRLYVTYQRQNPIRCPSKAGMLFGYLKLVFSSCYTMRCAFSIVL